MKNIYQILNRPIKVLAPMADYTDSAYRQLCREYGADLVVTELISADAIFYQHKNWYCDANGEWQSKKENDGTLRLLKFTKEERPILVQLFGKHPEKFAFAARWVTENLNPEGIDINMGCPAKKVVGSFHGAALMKDYDLAAEIVKAVKSSTHLPVSVKTRLGWSDDDEILEFAPVLVNAGITALTIHGRTYKDGYRGPARWENIYKVKEMFPELVVIGNGDVTTISNPKFQMTNHKGTSTFNLHSSISLDGYMIGRGTFGKPWTFSKDSITDDELKNVIKRHAELVFDRKGDHGIIEFRKHLLAYLKGFPGAKDLRKEAVLVKNIKEIDEIIDILNN